MKAKELLKRIGTALLGSYLFGAVYLVPPDVDDLRLSAVSKGEVKIGTWVNSACLSDGNVPKRCHREYSVLVNGRGKTAIYSCVLIPKIKCRMGTPTLKVSTKSFQALEKNAVGGYSSAETSLVDVRSESYNSDYFIVCGAIGTASGNLLLTSLNDAGGSSYDPYNPSYLFLSYSEFCQ